MKRLCFRFKGIVISFSHLNNLISCWNSFLENYSNSQCQCTSFQMIWCLSICLSWLVEREELHFRTDWYSTKTWNISHAQFVLLFNYHSWWSEMGESSSYVYYVHFLRLSWLTYPAVKSYITITTPASFFQFLTFFCTHKTCQELLDVQKSSYY